MEKHVVSVTHILLVRMRLDSETSVEKYNVQVTCPVTHPLLIMGQDMRRLPGKVKCSV